MPTDIKKRLHAAITGVMATLLPNSKHNMHRIDIRAYAYLEKLALSTLTALHSLRTKGSQGFDITCIDIKPGVYASVEQRLAGMSYIHVARI